MKLALFGALALCALLCPTPSDSEAAGVAAARVSFEPSRAAVEARPIIADAALASQTPAPRSYRVGDLVVDQPWSRPPPGGAKVIAGYMRVTNTGAASDRLIGGSSPIAGRLEIHASALADGVIRMRRLGEGIEIPPGETVIFKPGGKHLMLADLTESAQGGAPFPATLIFEKAGPVRVEFAVGPFGESPDEAAP